MSPIWRAAVNLVAWFDPALKVWLNKIHEKLNDRSSKCKDKEIVKDTV